MTTLTAPIKTITYDRLTGDYKMELDGEFVGYAACYHVAEIELDRLAYEQLDRAGVEPELLLSATALDGGSSVEEIAAEYAETLPTCKACHTNAHAASAMQPAFCTECVYAMLQGRKNRLDTSTPDDDQPADDPGHDLITPDPNECPSTTEPTPVEDLPACHTGDQLLDEAGDLLTRLVGLKAHLLYNVPSGETMSDRCARSSKLRRVNYTIKCAGRRLGRRFVALPALLAEPDDAPPGDEPADEDGDDWPDGIDDVLAPPFGAGAAFILPNGTTMQSIILCVSGVSRVVSAQGVAEALTLASVHTR